MKNNNVSADEIKKAIKQIDADYSCFEQMSSDLRGNKQVALAAISAYDYNYQYISKNLLDDVDLAKAAIKDSGNNIEYSGASIKNNYEIGMLAVNNYGGALKYLSKNLRANLKIVKAAIMQDAKAIEFANPTLKGDKKLALFCVKKDGLSIKYLNTKLKSDNDIIKSALRQNPESANYIKGFLKGKRSILLSVLSQGGILLKYLDSKSQNNFEIVLKAVRQNGNAIKYASKELRSNFNLAKVAVKTNGESIKYFDKKIKSDPVIIDLAVKQNSAALDFISVKDKAIYLSKLKNVSLEVQIWNRGKEVYGIKYPGSKFNKQEFLKKYKNNYYELTDESILSEIPINDQLGITINVNGINVVNSFNPSAIKLVESKEKINYRNELNANLKDTCVIWFHDYVNTCSNRWENILQYDINNIIIYYSILEDATDNTTYKVFSSIEYLNCEPDDIDNFGEPKSGYNGPYII